MNKRLLMLTAVSALAVAACSNNNNGGGSTISGVQNDFTSYVAGVVGTQPADATPIQADSLTNVGVDNTQAFANVQFSGGDTIPSGTYSAAAACTSAGSAACSPGLH